MQAFVPSIMAHLYILKTSPILSRLNLLSVSFPEVFPLNSWIQKYFVLLSFGINYSGVCLILYKMENENRNKSLEKFVEKWGMFWDVIS